MNGTYNYIRKTNANILHKKRELFQGEAGTTGQDRAQDAGRYDNHGRDQRERLHDAHGALDRLHRRGHGEFFHLAPFGMVGLWRAIGMCDFWWLIGFRCSECFRGHHIRCISMSHSATFLFLPFFCLDGTRIRSLLCSYSIETPPNDCADWERTLSTPRRFTLARISRPTKSRERESRTR